jgi:hypothetical protein
MYRSNKVYLAIIPLVILVGAVEAAPGAIAMMAVGAPSAPSPIEGVTPLVWASPNCDFEANSTVGKSCMIGWSVSPESGGAQVVHPLLRVQFPNTITPAECAGPRFQWSWGHLTTATISAKIGQICYVPLWAPSNSTHVTMQFLPQKPFIGAVNPVPHDRTQDEIDLDSNRDPHSPLQCTLSYGLRYSPYAAKPYTDHFSILISGRDANNENQEYSARIDITMNVVN